MKRNALASLALAFGIAFFGFADNLGSATKVGSLSRSTDYVYTADQADVLFAARVPLFRTINGHSLSNNVTITASDIGVEDGANAYTHPSYTPRTGAPGANATPAFGGTFDVSQTLTDSQGHVTNLVTRTVTIPNAAATTSAAGLMSAADKSKLNGIASGATKGITQIKFDRGSAGDVYLQQGGTTTLIVGNHLSVTATSSGLKMDVTGIPSVPSTATATPLMDGTAAVGTSGKWAKEDHVHPTDTSRASAGDLSAHTNNATIHITASERTSWNGAATAAAGAVSKTALAAALQAQGLSAANDTAASLDDMDTIAAKLAAVIAVLDALD